MNAATLIAQAKSRATPVASCVRARVQPSHLIGEDTPVKELLALITVLAEVADHRRLAELAKLPGDEGLPTGEGALLRAAHAHVWHLKRDGRPVPYQLRLLDSEYGCRRERKRPSRGTGARLAWIAQQQQQEGKAA